jgi:hypothetical protein
MPVRLGGRLLSDADALSHIRQAWARQELQPRLRVNLPPIQLHPQPQPPPPPRVRVEAPRIARFARPPLALPSIRRVVKSPPVEVFEEEKFEEDPQVADLHKRVEKFRQTSLEPDAERLMFSALYVQHTKTKSKYVKRNKELVARNNELVAENKELVAENLALKQQIQQISELREHDLKCSISCEVFRDPVILRDGHTYERVDIEQWFNMGNTTSPLTNQVINRPPLFVPNRIVKNMVSALALN